MVFNNEIQKYLKGELFHNSLAVNVLAKDKGLSYSVPFFTELARDKRVIHIGACDHIDSIDRKIAKGNWLHRHLIDVSERCIGVDINSEGIEYLKNNHSISDVYCADVTKDKLSFLGEEEWDIVFLPDVLEHISDVSTFLQQLNSNFAGKAKNLVIAVPNAFCLRNLTNIFFKGIEKINSDHRYWFTAYTLAKLLTEAGFKSIELNYVIRGMRVPNRNVDVMFKKILWKSKPCLRDTIVINCEF